MATTSASTTDTGERVGLYLAKFVVGNEGMPGAPLLHVQALVDAVHGTLSGHAQITQAIAPPDGEIRIGNLTGRIHGLGFGEGARAVALSGSYDVALPPPAIGTLVVPVSATLVIEEDAWVGRGSFSYGAREVEDVPVAPER